MDQSPIDSVKPYSKNAKQHPKKQIQQIAASIKRFGFNQPLVVDKNNEIIVGHGRWLAAKELGLKEVPFIRLENLTEKEIKAYRLSDNKLNESEWNMDLAIEELKELDQELLDLTGFDKDLLIEPDEKDDLIPENPPAISKLGDLYELGNHRVLCGDATKKEDVEKLMNGKKADLLLSDPPYGVSYIEKNAAVSGGVVHNAIGKQIENDTQSVEDISNKTWFPSFENGFNSCKDDSSYLIFSCQGGELMMMMMMIQRAGWMVKHMLIWAKQDFVLGRCDYHYSHEPILYGWKQKEKHNFYGGRKEQSVLNFDRPRRSDLHPTTKPLSLIEYLVINHSKQDDIVLDLFLGSGSTLIAAQKTDRICYGSEIDPKYIDVIVQRYCEYVNNYDIIRNGQQITWPKKQEVDQP